MTVSGLRRAAVPLGVALLVGAVLLGIYRLVDPTGVGPGGTVVGAPGSAGGGATGSTGTGTPPSGDDTPADPDQPMSRFSSVRPGPDDSSLLVRFWGGVDTCYRYTVQTEETAASVSLGVEEEVTFQGACIDLAQEYDRTVRLTEALAGRDVLDATTGEVLFAPSP